MTKFLAGLFALAVCLSLAAQQPVPPAFKSNVDAITLDVRVVDQSGTFVDGLTKDDLKIFEDGREQTITAFDRVNIPIHADERPLFAGQSIDADVASNAWPTSDAAEGRLYVLLLDDLHTNPGRSVDVRAQARDFIEHHFAESDRAVVLTTSGRVKVAQEFTNNRQRLLRAVDQFEGGFAARTQCGAIGLADGGTIDSPLCTCADDRDALHSLSGLARWLTPVNGRRKALLLFGEGISDQTANAVAGTAADPHTSQGYDITGLAAEGCAKSIIDDRREAANEAARANMTVYPLDPRRSPDALFTRIVTDTSSSYLLGYVPTNSKHDGTLRTIDVRALHPGLKVEARTGYTAKNDAAAKPTSSSSVSPALTALMATPIQISGLTMSVTAPAYAGSGSKASVEVIIDVAGRDLIAASAASGGKGSLGLLVAVADANGHAQATEHGSLDMNLSAATRDQVAQHGLRVMSRLDVAPAAISCESQASMAAATVRAAFNTISTFRILRKVLCR